MTYEPNEIVDIAIKGARVSHEGGPGWLNFFAGGTAHRLLVAAPGVTVERVAPAEWPPQPADLWRDREGELWFAARHWPDCDDRQDSRGANAYGWRVVLVPLELGEQGSPCRPEDVLQPSGPFTLVRREDGAA